MEGLEMNSKNLAIFLPGIGYHNDKPLLYFSRKLAVECGYDTLNIEYHDLPGKVMGDKAKMMEAVNIAFRQAEEALDKLDLSSYDKFLLVGKSIGTVIATGLVAKRGLNAKLVLYTPVEATFMNVFRETGCGDVTDGPNCADVYSDAVAFIGTNDPWSDLETVKALAREKNVPLHLYPGANHSLERNGAQEGSNTLAGSTTLENIKILEDVMAKTLEFIAPYINHKH